MARRRKKVSSEIVTAKVESLSQEGRGVAHIDGKTVFIDGALPGEVVKFSYVFQRRKFDEASVVEVLEPVSDRVEPQCAHFLQCGACSLQHLSAEAQLQAKQDALLESLEHMGNVQAKALLPALQADTWGYRRKARLSVRYVPKKERVLVGFREKRSSFVADLQRCEVLHPSVGLHLLDIGQLIESLSIRDSIPQVEIAVDDQTTCLVFRVLEELQSDDNAKLVNFAKEHNVSIQAQPGGVDTIYNVWPVEQVLQYSVDDGDICLQFKPTDFTQVNASINRLMLKQAMDLLMLNQEDRVLDLFCGLGNFSLPMAKRAASVIGVEGAAEMVERAQANARLNGLDNVEFYVGDLFEEKISASWLKQNYNKVLIDPPRSGAKEIIPQLPVQQLERIVYVSCNPATLARDANVLVHKLGFTLEKAGVMDMFPHTAHSEAMALFVR